ncbi:MAG: hypothetical protein WDN45_17330 [Caulobacteraceae bacterium]
MLSDEYAIPEGRMDHLMAVPLAAEFPEIVEQVAAEPLAEGVVEILCVGTVEPRKNHERLLDAFDLASKRSAVSPAPDHRWRRHSFEPDLAVRVKARVDASASIDWEQKADDARIKQLYARCAFTIYPSIEEGLRHADPGMPVVRQAGHLRRVRGPCSRSPREAAASSSTCVTSRAMAAAICELANAP